MTLTLISPTDGSVSIGPANADGSHPIVTNATNLPIGSTINVTVKDGAGKLLTVPVMVEDRIPVRDRFRNVLTVAQPQWQTDIQASEIARMHSGFSLGTFTHTAVKDGDHDDPTVWNTGTVPHLYQPVAKQIFNWRRYVRTGNKDTSWDTVIVGTAVINTSTFHVRFKSDCFFKHIHGGGRGLVEFYAAAGQSIRLIGDSWIFHGRRMTHVDGPEYSTDGTPRIQMIGCRQTTPDTSMLGTMMEMGPTRWYGSNTKATSMFAAATIPANATTFTVPNLASSGWRAGDVVVRPRTEDYSESATSNTFPVSPAQYGFTAADSRCPINPATPDTNAYHKGNYGVSKHIYAIITAISGDQLTLDRSMPVDQLYLRGTINGAPVGLAPEIINISRPIEMCSADPFTRLNRFCHMAMHPDFEQWGVGHIDMGQSAIDATLVPGNSRYDVHQDNAGGLPRITDDTNVIGKYAHHLHFTGAAMCDRMAITYGGSFANPSAPFHGVGARSHGSRHAFVGNGIVDFTAIGWGSENGNEISQVENNVVVGCTGDGYDLNGNEWPLYYSAQFELYKQMGHSGVAFENQSRGIRARGNRSYGCVESWLFMSQECFRFDADIWDENLQAPAMTSTSYVDPMTYGGGDNGVKLYHGIGQKDGAMEVMEDNISIGCKRGLHITERAHTDRGNTLAVNFRRNHCFGTKYPVMFDQYVNGYNFRDALWTAQNMQPNAAASLGGAASWALTFANCAVNNLQIGFLDNGIGPNYDGFFYNIDFQNCPTPFQQNLYPGNGRDGTVYNDPHSVPSYGIMGEWYNPDWTPVGTTFKDTGHAIYCRKWVNLTAADLNQNGKVGTGLPAGGQEYAGVDPRPVGQQGTSGFYFLPSSIQPLNYGDGEGALGASGAVIDGFGVRILGANTNIQEFPDILAYRAPRTYSRRTVAQVVEHNGLWMNGNQPTMRVHWFYNDRLTDAEVRGYFDQSVNGVPADVLARLTALTGNDPNSTMQLNIGKNESLATKPFLPFTTVPPAIVSATSLTMHEDATVAFPLRADSAFVGWSFDNSTPDKTAANALWEIAGTVLRIVGNGTPDSVQPGMKGQSRTSTPSLICTATFTGISTPYSPSIAIAAVTQGPVDSFSDSFDGPAGDLSIPVGNAAAIWTNNSGSPNGAITRDGNGQAIISSTTVTAYVGPQLTHNQSNIELDYAGAGSDGGTAICPTFFTNGGFIALLYAPGQQVKWFSSATGRQADTNVFSTPHAATTVHLEARQTGATQITVTATRDGSQMIPPFVINDPSAVLNGQVGLFNLLGADVPGRSGYVQAVRVTAVA